MRVNNHQTLIFWGIVAVICLTGTVLAFSAATGSKTGNSLVINEFVASNGAGLTDEDGDTPDWIEIFNPSTQPINLSGWYLTDDPALPQKWPFPNLTLPPQQYLLVFASGKNRQNPEAPLHTNFKLSKSGEFLGLYRLLDQQFIDSISTGYTTQFRDMAFGRIGDGPTWAYLGQPTPGSSNSDSQFWLDLVKPVQFSVERGFYEAPLSLELSTTTPGTIIRYTTDGSQPGAITGTLYTAPIPISGTTIVKAGAFRPDYLPSTVVAHSYIFPDDVLVQPPNPPGFPDTWGVHRETFKQHQAGSPVWADYEMDPTVINDPHYRDIIKGGLKSIPTLSLAMNVDDFTALYSHPRDRGVDWERPASVELIDPNSLLKGFQVNAGLRMHGGVGRKEFIPKHSFRLLFKSRYGPSRLNYPLFPNSPVDTFNTLILRAGADRSFAGTGPIRENTTYTRDEWLRTSQLDMSGVGSHGIFVHLYVNGLYWGLYNVVERPDEAFMASYFGGQEEDWFVANQDGPLSRESNEWRDALSELFITIGFKGRQDDTLEKTEAQLAQQFAQIEPHLDMAQFSDYIILNWYAGTEDWPQNNWYAGIPKPPGRGKYLVWDGQEIFSDGARTTLGKISSARLNIVKPLFEILIQNPDFKMTFADRAYTHLFNSGALTDANAQARWLEINSVIDRAIIAESARWGDVWFDQPITQHDWFKARDEVLAQMDGNAEKLVGLLRAARYYPTIDPPVFNRRGGLVDTGFTLTMSLPPEQSKGTIYYTLDNTDPRMWGTENVASSAIAYSTPVVLTTTTHVKARQYHNNTWSALQEATFSVIEQDKKLQITEIMYNPPEGGEYEFIELKNSGLAAIDLSNMWFEGIDFTFPAATTPLEPGQFVVLVSDPNAFGEQYPNVPIGGIYGRRLSNGGEEIALKDAEGATILSITYDDDLGWPITPDGRGDSLVLVNPNGDPNDPKSWRASAQLNGSPGADDPQFQKTEQFAP